MEWRPIDTAPMDGTAIWLLHEGRPHLGYGEPPSPRRETERWVLKTGIRKRDDAPDEIYGCYVSDACPTHWAPLPAPPA